MNTRRPTLHPPQTLSLPRRARYTQRRIWPPHPADKGHGIPLPLSLKAGHRGPVRYVQPEPRPTPNAGPSTSARPPEPARPAKPVRPANTMEPAKTVDADKPPQPVPPIVQELDAGAGIKNHRVEPLITLPEDEEVCCTIRILA